MITEIKDSSNSLFDCWRGYDSNNNMVSYRSNGYSETRTYVNNKLTHMIDSNGYQIWVEYDGNGNVTKYWNSYGYRVDKQYDHLGRLVSYCDTDGKKNKTVYADDFDKVGRVIMGE